MSPAEVHNLSNDIMTPFAMETMTEDEILKNRMAIIDNLFDIHQTRISEFNGSLSEIDLEEMEQLIETGGWETESSETESSEKKGSVMQDKGKGKAEDSSANNDKGKAEDSSANNDKGKAEDVERQFYEDTLLAMELSKNYKNYSDKDGDDSKHYEPESSKGRKSYKK
jgi:hypothetical protein